MRIARMSFGGWHKPKPCLRKLDARVAFFVEEEGMFFIASFSLIAYLLVEQQEQ